jgi:hypothetical protein
VKKAPNPKLQDPEKHQAPKTNPAPQAMFWSLMFGASLELGIWSFKNDSA